MNYPEEIMHDVAWSFVGMQYRSQKQFIEAVNDYNEKLGTTGRWNPLESICYRNSMQRGNYSVFILE